MGEGRRRKLIKEVDLALSDKKRSNLEEIVRRIVETAERIAAGTRKG